MIEDNKVVTIDYTLKDDADTVLDTSEGREPLVYLHGASNIIPGLEKALSGMTVGDDFEVTVEPVEAYGEYNPEMVQQVPKDAFQGVEEIEPGMRFNAQGAQGPIQVVVTNVDEAQVTVDANHPLAGKILNFNGTIRDVRDASDEEIEHGHAH